MKKLLIVEDSFLLFLTMKNALLQNTSLLGIPLEIQHVDNLEEAKREFVSFRPDIVSTGISYPAKHSEEKETYTRVSFVEFFMTQRQKSILVIYSEQPVAVVKRELSSQAKLSRKMFPEIIPKETEKGHSFWVYQMLQKLE